MIEKLNSEKVLNEISEIRELKDVLSYNASEENLKDCQPFEELNQKYILLQKQYGDSFNKLYDDVKVKVYRREYAKGGVGFHRGFYSPSMMDLVVGGLNRGRILKRPPKNNYNYEYVFNEQDDLICVYCYDFNNGIHRLQTTELFVYEQNKVMSLVFDSDNSHGLSFMSECQYKDGRLIRYENVLCELFYGGKGCTEINVETHEYVDDLLQTVYWYRYMPSIHLLTQEKFTFASDEEGYLSTYTVEHLGGFKPKTNFDCGSVIYDVRVKRK